MARKSSVTTKSTLALPKVAHKRFSYECRTGQASRAGKIAFKAFNEEPIFTETEEGHLVRQWKKEELQRFTHGDIAQALRGRHVVEEEDMLEYIPPSAVKYAVTMGWLYRDGPFYRVTRKAHAELNLPRSVAGRKICFFNAGM